MAQFLKPETAEQITQAALRVFASRGYRDASMADIAREAGISTGNVYRYFANKETLFAHAVPAALGTQLLSLLRARVKATGTRHFADAAGELLRFSLEHRLQLVVMLGRAEGSEHAGLRDKAVKLLVQLALAHFGERERDAPFLFALTRAYEHFVATMVTALEVHDDPADIRAAVHAYNRYHLAGLTALFEGAEP